MTTLTARAVVDRARFARAIERRSAPAIAKRADLLGIQMERIIAQMIDRELGPSSGRSERRGMVSMRSINWQHTVHNPGHLPISVTLFSPDLTGRTAQKFGALNFGWSASYSRPQRANEIRTGGWTGKQWLRRTGTVATGRAVARFL